MRIMKSINTRMNVAHAIRTKHKLLRPVMPVLMPVCDRAEYLSKVLEGLMKCDDIEKV